MGAGKSSVARAIARRTGLRFRDTDLLVRARVGAPIPEIFQTHGEAFFRAEEVRALEELRGARGVVLATGGGILLDAANGPRLQALGPVVWLTANQETIWERVSRNPHRPLLRTDEPRATFEALWEARQGLYAAWADLQVDSTGLAHDAVARQILDAVQGWRRREHQGGVDVPGESPGL